MRLKDYTNEEVRNNIENIVMLDVAYIRNEYQVYKPEIVKVTEKTFKTPNRIVRFSDIGYMSYRTVFLFEKDIEYAIGVYQRKIIDVNNRKIEEAEREIELVKQIKRIN